MSCGPRNKILSGIKINDSNFQELSCCSSFFFFFFVCTKASFLKHLKIKHAFTTVGVNWASISLHFKEYPSITNYSYQYHNVQVINNCWPLLTYLSEMDNEICLDWTQFLTRYFHNAVCITIIFYLNICTITNIPS